MDRTFDLSTVQSYHLRILETDDGASNCAALVYNDYDVVIGGRCCSTNLLANLHAQDIIRTCIWIRIPQGDNNESHGP
jgi:hypothetical protein